MTAELAIGIVAVVYIGVFGHWLRGGFWPPLPGSDEERRDREVRVAIRRWRRRVMRRGG